MTELFLRGIEMAFCTRLGSPGVCVAALYERRMLSTAVMDRRYRAKDSHFPPPFSGAIWGLENFAKLSVIQTFHHPFSDD